MLTLPPLSLYIHIPWCVEKCPYCDFNSHAIKEELPQQQYVEDLVNDLKQDLNWVQGRKLESIFIGGGTPSVIEPEHIAWLLTEVERHIDFATDIEITLEANPGTIEAGRFEGYLAAGVNRISVGVQSFASDKLKVLGRIHNPEEATSALQQALALDFNSVNLDLMFALPQQTVEQALDDLRQAINLNVPHLSWYQLTIEPNTAFYSQPPTLPNDELIWQMFEQGSQLLIAAGYTQYEVSAWSKPNMKCRHNLNYWRFGDYLGIGCGSHGKVTDVNSNAIIRTVKVKHPKGYLDKTRNYMDSEIKVEPEDLSFEYFLNRMRLFEAVPKDELITRTGLLPTMVKEPLQWGINRGMLIESDGYWTLTKTGHRYLNSLLEQFI